MAILATGWAVGAQAAPGGPPATVKEILACLQSTRPLTSTVRTLDLRSVDRAGGEQAQRVVVYGGLSREGFRTLLVQVVEPRDARGLSILITEREGANHLFVSPAGLPEVKQIRGAPGQGSLLRTDFSYEDLERLYGLTRPHETHKLKGLRVAESGRRYWLLETTPEKQSTSVYRRIVSRVDQETCVLMRAEMYQADVTPRKILTSLPESVRREGSTWVAHQMRMRDLRDGSETRLLVDAIDLDAKNEGVPFSPEALAEQKRAAAGAAR